MDTDLLSTLNDALGGTYAMERELGGGGMSRVFVAADRSLGRKVVIKVLPSALQSPAMAERFRREVALLASLRHPHIVPLLAGGEAGGLLYYTMPYVEGESLRARLDREGALPVNEAVRITREIADALSYAHKRGVVHRDLKPANILLDESGALVADFGIARVLTETGAGLTGTGMGIGTPGYMAPEQAAADPTMDHRADIYALGAVAYEMIAGRRPYLGATHQVLVAQAQGKMDPLTRVRPGTPVRVERVITRALQPNPTDRWTSAEEVLRELENTDSRPAVAAAPDGGWRRVAIPIAAVVLLAIAGGVYALRQDAAPAEHDPSVAVLPFVNMGDSTNAYFADGMTEEIINALAGVPGLRIPARTSSFAFKGQTSDLRGIAAQLGVAHVVEGSVRRDADRLRVTAQLIKAEDGFHVWSRSFDADARDIFRVQDSISREIVRALLPHLRGQQLNLVREATENPEAYAHYLQGLQEFNRRLGNAIPNAIVHYRAALALDPSYAAAHAGLATAYASSVNYVFPEIPGAVDSSMAAAQRAVALDARSAEAYTALAAALGRVGRNAEATEAVRAALAVNPRHALAHQWYAYALRRNGELDSAVAHAQIARALDPLSPSARGALAQMYLSARRFAEAEREYSEMLKSDSSNAQTYLTYGVFNVAHGRYADAVPLLAEARRRFPRSVTPGSMLAYSYARLGRQADAEQAAKEVEELLRRLGPTSRDITAYLWVLEARGDRDAAVDWLIENYDTRSNTAFPPSHPLYDPFRTHPRFREYARTVEQAERSRR